MTIKKPILISGITTSGHLTLGHLIGAISNWTKMLQEFDCLFFLADLHAITVRQDPQELLRRCYDMVALYIACGIDPEKNTIFVQSQVPAHTQLAWILNCYAQTGELNRMTQFKDKSKRHASNITAGLYNYPVLMAADILLYEANCVPVGEDQKQHLELTRDLALRFNHYYGEILTIPEPYIAPQGARIMSLQDPTQKMSKSDENVNNYVALLDSPDIVRNKLKRSVTDSGNEIRLDASKPGISNLLTIFSSLSGKSITQLEMEYQTSGYGKFKNDVAEVIVSKLTPIQEKFHALRDDETLLKNILNLGAEKARARAAIILQKVHDAVGLIAS